MKSAIDRARPSPSGRFPDRGKSYVFGGLFSLIFLMGVGLEAPGLLLQGLAGFAGAIDMYYRRRPTREQRRRAERNGRRLSVLAFVLAIVLPVIALFAREFGLRISEPPVSLVIVFGLAVNAVVLAYHLLLPRIRRSA